MTSQTGALTFFAVYKGKVMEQYSQKNLFFLVSYFPYTNSVPKDPSSDPTRYNHQKARKAKFTGVSDLLYVNNLCTLNENDNKRRLNHPSIAKKNVKN